MGLGIWTAFLARRPERFCQVERFNTILPVLLVLDDFIEEIEIGRLTKGGQGHHLVFVRRMQEP